MEQSGTPCPFEGKIGKAASDQWKKYDKLRPDYEMYTERLWKIEQVKKDIKKKQELQEWKNKLEVKKEVEGDTSETDALAEEIKKLQETIAEDKKKVKNK
jgi:hypothetical protein